MALPDVWTLARYQQTVRELGGAYIASLPANARGLRASVAGFPGARYPANPAPGQDFAYELAPADVAVEVLGYLSLLTYPIDQDVIVQTKLRNAMKEAGKLAADAVTQSVPVVVWVALGLGALLLVQPRRLTA